MELLCDDIVDLVVFWCLYDVDDFCCRRGDVDVWS